MTRKRRLPFLCAALLTASACSVPHGDAAARKAQEQAVLTKRELRTQAALARSDSGAPNPEAIARWLMPKSLKEISGIGKRLEVVELNLDPGFEACYIDQLAIPG